MTYPSVIGTNCIAIIEEYAYKIIWWFSYILFFAQMCSVKGTIERYKKAYSNDTGHANSSNELTAQVNRLLITKIYKLFSIRSEYTFLDLY